MNALQGQEPCDEPLPPVRLCPDAGTRKRKCPGGEFRGRGKKQISYLQGVVTMSDETVKVKEIHASLERIRRISMLRDRVVELLTRMIEAEQEYIKRLERVLS